MKSYIYTLLMVAALTIAGNTATSLIVDPYSIVHPLIGEFAFEPNSRFSKVAFLLQNCARFDTYIAGDSRSVILSESDFPAVHGRKFYNIASAGDDIASIVKRLEFLIGRGCPIAAVVVGGSLDATLRSSANGLSRRECPAISGESRPIFYARYFLSSQALMDYVSILVSGTSHPLRYYADGHADYMWSMKSDFAEACAPQTTPAKNTLLAELSIISRRLCGLRQGRRSEAPRAIPTWNSTSRNCVLSPTFRLSSRTSSRHYLQISIIGTIAFIFVVPYSSNSHRRRHPRFSSNLSSWFSIAPPK
jgi:hypothetical protein